jgi:hypothetical protein
VKQLPEGERDSSHDDCFELAVLDQAN